MRENLRVCLPKIKSAIESEIKTLIDTLTQSQFQEDRITFPVSGVRVWPHLFVAKAGRCWIYSLANHKEHKWLGMVASGRRVSHVLKFQPPGGSQYWIKTTVRAAPDDSEKREELEVQYIQESLGLLMLFSVLENLATIFLPKLPLIKIGASERSSHDSYVLETDSPYWAGEHQATSALPELLLNDATLKSFDQFEFNRVSAILEAQHLSEVEEAIHDSIGVCYYSFASPDPVWRYIGLVTALERLLRRLMRAR